MADTAQVLGAIRRVPGVAYPVLVPNLEGLELARQAEAAESRGLQHRLGNLQSPEHQLLGRGEPDPRRRGCGGGECRRYSRSRLRFLRPGVSLRGLDLARQVARVATRLFRLGCYEVSLGDTIGVGTPLAAREMVECVAASVPVERLALHFHDTYGQALANILACLELGIGVVDSAVAGLGGCPYAPGATGNVATEDVLYMLHGSRVRTGVDLDLVTEAGRFISSAIGKNPVSRVSRARAG